jgi:putative tricarboxylic transport membrane protein
MRMGRDAVAGLICLAVSLVLLVISFDLPRLALVPVGPGFYPRIVLVFMAVVSLVLIVQDLHASRAPREPTTAEKRGPGRAYGLVAAAFGIIGAYVLLLPMLGYRIATALFVGSLQAALDRPATLRQWVALAGLALATSGITYIVFERYLSVLLPRGIWTGW